MHRPVTSNVRAHEVTHRMVAASLALAGIVLTAGIAFGWQNYLANPEGQFLYTPRDWCAPRSHSFTVAFSLSLIAAVVLLVIVAAVAFVASFISFMSSRRVSLRATAKVCVVAVPLVTPGALLHVPFEGSYLYARTQRACSER